MGNKSSTVDRRHSFDDHLNDGVSRDRKKNKKDGSKKRPTSTPVSTAVEHSPNDSKSLDVKIYRSTTTIEEVQKRTQQAIDPANIRVYRRSAAGDQLTTTAATCRGGSQTLPRNFGRNGSIGRNGSRSSEQLTLTRAPRGDGTMTPSRDSRDPGRLPSGRSVTAEDDMGYQVATGVTMRPPSTGSSTYSSLANNTIVSPDDFPDTAAIKRRLQQFEVRFVDRFTALYSALPEAVQLSALSVAVRRHSAGGLFDHVDHAAITVSLWNFLNPTAHSDLPADLPADKFAPTVPIELLNRLIQLRLSSDNSAGDRSHAVIDSAELRAVVRDVVRSVATEAASAVATSFEYQIAMLGDGLPCQLLADRAADCSIEFLKKTNRHVDVNSVARGVVCGRPADTHRLATVSVLVGSQRELKWNIDEVLHSVGLRRDRLPISANVDGPWRYFATSAVTPDPVDPLLYGYRGQLLNRDFQAEQTDLSGIASKFYVLDEDEEAMFDVEAIWRPDDFHRLYRPYRRLVGVEVVEGFRISQQTDGCKTLTDYVQSLHGDNWRRDEIEAVPRPVATQRRRTRPEPVGIRPRCVSDAEEFSRQQAVRRTWCPAVAATVAPSRNNGHQPPQRYQPLEMAMTQNPISGPSFDDPDIYRRVPNSAPALVDPNRRRTVHTTVTTTNIIMHAPPNANQVATGNEWVANGNYSQYHHPQQQSQYNVPSDRRSFVSSSSGFSREPQQHSADNYGHNSTSSASSPVPSGFPTMEQLFAKEIRAMKAKTVHVTDFPVFDGEGDEAMRSGSVSPSGGEGSVRGREEKSLVGNGSTSPVAAAPSSELSGSPPVLVTFVPCSASRDTQRSPVMTSPPAAVTPPCDRTPSSPGQEWSGMNFNGSDGGRTESSVSHGGVDNGFHDDVTSPGFGGNRCSIMISNV